MSLRARLRALPPWLLAAGMHVAVFTAVGRLPATPEARSVPEPEAFEVEFEVERDEAPSEREVVVEETPSQVAALAPRSVEPVGRSSVGAAGREAEGGAATSDGVAAESGAAGEDVVRETGQSGWSFSPLQRSSPTSVLGGEGLAALPRAQLPASAEAAPAAGIGRAVGRALDGKDAERGFARGGAILSVAERIVREAVTLVEGRATFDAHIDERGRITVSLHDASRDYGGWEKLAPAIAKAVDTRRLHIPSGVPWNVTVEVEARLQFRDGTNPRELGTKAIVSGKGDNGHPGYNLPGVGLAHRGKVCSAGVVVGPAGLVVGGGCSPENAGAVAQRIVRGRVVRDQRM